MEGALRYDMSTTTSAANKLRLDDLTSSGHRTDWHERRRLQLATELESSAHSNWHPDYDLIQKWALLVRTSCAATGRAPDRICGYCTRRAVTRQLALLGPGHAEELLSLCSVESSIVGGQQIFSKPTQQHGHTDAECIRIVTLIEAALAGASDSDKDGFVRAALHVVAEAHGPETTVQRTPRHKALVEIKADWGVKPSQLAARSSESAACSPVAAVGGENAAAGRRQFVQYALKMGDSAMQVHLPHFTAFQPSRRLNP